MNEPEVIASYSQQEALDDGVLVKVFENRWKQLTGGKPLLATAAINSEFSQAAIMEIWNDYVKAQAKSKKQPGNPWVTKMNDQTVWVIEDEAALTILFPS